MRKRKSSFSSEVEVDDDEEKMELQENVDDDDDDDDDDEDIMEDPGDDDEDEDEEEKERSAAHRSLAVSDNPFMDSFYGLSAADAKVRSQASQVLIQHCLLGPNANAKDAAYTLRRLLNGICSGRAAARQGNASALAAFLNIVFRLVDESGDGDNNMMQEIREIDIEMESSKIDEKDDESEGSSDSDEDDDQNYKNGTLLVYVRKRLLDATDPKRTTGKKRGSEERDYQFGRLFGILAIVRSNILLPSKNDSDDKTEELQQVAMALVSDLVELFWLKKWMREPAAHGITTVLKLYFDRPSSKECDKIAWNLVNEVVVPKILRSKGDNQEKEMGREALIQSFCAEQVGIAAYIQSQAKQGVEMPFPLDEAVVTVESMTWIGSALGETSSVVHPRTHFVWDALWCYLTEEVIEEKARKSTVKVARRRLRETIPGGGDRPIDVIDSILTIVVKEKLLRLQEDLSGGKATHERRSLALCIVRNLSGAPFPSSITGATSLLMEDDTIETILLTPQIVRALFLNVICAGKGKQHSSHLLKPLAVEILSSITDAAMESIKKSRQMALAKAFLSCEVRFDAYTKMSAVSNLLAFSESTLPTNEDFGMWNEYLDFLEANFLRSCASMTDPIATAEANGYIELMLGAAKGVLRTRSDGFVDQKKEIVVMRILGFLMASAFFDCSGVIKPAAQQSKKKKKKSGNQTDITLHPAMLGAVKIQDTVSIEIAHPIRAVASSRFFLLASEFAMAVSRTFKDDVTDGKVEKDRKTLVVLENLCDAWKLLESSGARRYGSERNDDDKDDENNENPDMVVQDLRKRCMEQSSTATSEEKSLGVARKRLSLGLAIFGLTLYLHRLTPGLAGDLEEDPDADEEGDEEEICNAIAGLKDISNSFLDETDAEDNPLLEMTEMCANILSSPLGSGSLGRGASPKLVREAIKYAWLGGLRLASAKATKEKTLLDDSVIGVLMQAVGADHGDNEGDEVDMDEDEEDNSDMEDEDEDDSNDGRIFSKAAQMIVDDDNDEDGDDPSRSAKDVDDDNGESEIKVDPNKLQTMLEEDIDADVDEDILEHHEGADAALVKLIKLKQDARKAGQQAREAIEISNQLRCTFLLELLLGRPDGWNRLFRTNTILKMVLPWLNHRKTVAIMTQKAVESGAKTGTGEKKSLLDRLTVLMRQKLCKLRLSSMPLACSVDMGLAIELVARITSEAMKAKDKEHASVCSSCLLFVLRTMPATQETATVASSAYGQVVCDWSTKRTGGAALLEELITHNPLLARAALVASLSQATQDARSPFLKLEAYRLLSLLLASTQSSNDGNASAMEKIAITKVHEAQDDLLASVKSSLADEAMSMPKRVRVIFKALEKLLPALSNPLSTNIVTLLAAIKTEMKKVVNGNQQLETASTKLVEMMDTRMTELMNESKDRVGDNKNDGIRVDNDDREDPATGIPTKGSKKKKKDKKKKKKR